MKVDLRRPMIQGSEREMILQTKSYLCQMVEQLQWAFDTLESGQRAETTTVVRVENSLGGSSNTENAETTFNEIKSLIIKSADIVNAYYDKMIEKFNGQYFAESSFGSYLENTSLQIETTSENVTQYYEHLQVLSDRTDEVSTELLEYSGEVKDLEGTIDEKDKALREELSALENRIYDIKAYIKTGLLNDDSTNPIYGLEIGQESKKDGETTFRRFARFTANRLGFYDVNGIEVAYISDKKLYIGEAEITKSYKIGNFVDYILPNGDVIEKWEGSNNG